ncbi:MAG: enoyl-CoA hydratase/isomerase family protein [Bacteroidia bacterium]|nr:enoyl-CoA hydratase/isomerase family protein [Bacteroidia bacterium]
MSKEVIEQGGVELVNKEGIATITFHHPKSNSLPGKVLKQLAETITSAGKDDNIKVLILKSEGEKAFCAGASFDELISIDNAIDGKEFFMGFARVINAARKCPKFILGRVQGKAVGGGVGMASASDCCYATNSAAVKLSELAIGIGPFVVGPAVQRKIGTSAFSELAINATEWKSAEWAKEKGLYNEVYNSIDELDDAINTLASKLAGSNPEAMMLLKSAAWDNTENWDTLLEERAEMSGKLVISEFTSNAINKFKAGAR